MLVQLGVRKADESEDDDEEEDEAADYLHALLSTKEEEPQETKEMKLKLDDLVAGDKRKGIGSSTPDEAKRLKTEAVLPSAKRCKLSEKEVVDVIHASPKMSIKQLIAKFKEFLTDKEDKDQFMRIVKVRLPKSCMESLGQHSQVDLAGRPIIRVRAPVTLIPSRPSAWQSVARLVDQGTEKIVVLQDSILDKYELS